MISLLSPQTVGSNILSIGIRRTLQENLHKSPTQLANLFLPGLQALMNIVAAVDTDPDDPQHAVDFAVPPPVRVQAVTTCH